MTASTAMRWPACTGPTCTASRAWSTTGRWGGSFPRPKPGPPTCAGGESALRRWRWGRTDGSAIHAHVGQRRLNQLGIVIATGDAALLDHVSTREQRLEKAELVDRAAQRDGALLGKCL